MMNFPCALYYPPPVGKATNGAKLAYCFSDMGELLPLPADKKTAHAYRMGNKMKGLEGQVEEAEEERKQLKHTKKIKMKSVFHKQASVQHELQMAMMKQEDLLKDSKHTLVLMERQKAVLELSLMTKKSAILRMDKAIAKEERQLIELERIMEKDNLKFEEVLRDNEKKSVEARTLFEMEARSKQEKNIKIKKLTAEIGTIKSEIAKFEEILTDYKRYKELLFKLSPQEWQQTQKTQAFKVLSAKDTLDRQSRKSEKSAVWNGFESKVSSPGTELPSMRKTKLSSAHSKTLQGNTNTPFSTNTKGPSLDDDSSENENEPLLYFTDPQQLLNLVTELTEQNLNLIQNSSKVIETLEGFQQSVETTRMKMEKHDEQLTTHRNNMKQRIDEEKEKGTKLKQKVQLHVSLTTEDQDVMWDSLDGKVAVVHHCCVDDRITNLSTLEKLANIESCLSSLLQRVQSIPEENLGMMKKIKDSERRSRHREERLKEQREKQKEKMRRYLEKSLADSKKFSTRKLLPRCMPVAQNIRASHVDITSAEDDIHAFLFKSLEKD
ncbi:cilia- and flagella-associated protein 100 [Cheilinus undulatus]|uniref:cilia- and flagella-associated protein 100 n=1 Tax=Cheilinus undulatus TaxID=241271 RepID=UPI001BD57338|nr:cilia- and flagella-associated protein 100 [Cheilinus undulatus]